MIDDKKRKPSKDFPAHAQVPVGKHALNPMMRMELHQPAGGAPSVASVPRMHDPYNILHTAPRSLSMLSTDSRASLLSLDENSGEFVLDPRLSHLSLNSQGQGHDQGHRDDETERESLSVPKHERPPQPANEREYFERMWAENFERSEAQVANTSAYIPVGAAGRLNRIKGFSLARDAATHRLYAVFRLEIECIVSEKQWTIYRRFHDFKQLAHQLKTQGTRMSPVPTRTLMRSLDTTFLQKRQLELDRWLREVLMVLSLENCKVDADDWAACCGDKAFHRSCRLVRHFLTHSANQPPAFEYAEVSGHGHSNGHGHSATPSTSTAAATAAATATGSSATATGSSASDGTAASVEMLRSSLRDSDMMGSYREGLPTSERRRSVVVQDVDEDGRLPRADAASTAASTAASSAAATATATSTASTLASSTGPPSSSRRTSLQSFDVLRLIGRGSFGKVLLVRKKQSSQLFAVKILRKSAIVQKQQVEHTRTERRVLASITHPFVVCLHYAFQSPEKLFFVLDYCPGGDLFFHLSRCGCFPEAMAKFYAAEIALALIHLHEQGIVYRDLKPENVMLDVDGHVKLADFGLAKEGIRSELDGTYTMCGTPEYLPPEILNRKGHGTAVDWWNLGMVLYEMLTGRPPWYTQDREELFTRLRGAQLQFPEGLSEEAMSLIQGLLTRDPAARLGAMDPREITYHPFFADVDWNALYHREVPPLYRPCQYTDPVDAANFEEEFTKLPLAEIESDGLSIASDAGDSARSGGGGGGGGAGGGGGSGRGNGDGTSSGASSSGAGRGSSSGRGGASTTAARRHTNSSHTSSAGRNSTLRNLSYTFAGFTYEGSFMTSSLSQTEDDSSDEYEAMAGETQQEHMDERRQMESGYR